jgi:hypothetical protein
VRRLVLTGYVALHPGQNGNYVTVTQSMPVTLSGQSKWWLKGPDDRAHHPLSPATHWDLFPTASDVFDEHIRLRESAEDLVERLDWLKRFAGSTGWFHHVFVLHRLLEKLRRAKQAQQRLYCETAQLYSS